MSRVNFRKSDEPIPKRGSYERLFRRLLESNSQTLGHRFQGEPAPSRRAKLETAIESAIDEYRNPSNSRVVTQDWRGGKVGCALFRESTWDSDHFGLKIGKVSFCLFDRGASPDLRRRLFAEIRSTSKRKGFNLLFVRLPLMETPSIQAAEGAGSILTDVLVTFVLDVAKVLIAPSDRAPPGIKVVAAEMKDANALCRLSDEMFTLSHFHNDPMLPRKKCDQLYSMWTLNSLRGMADAVLIAKEGKKPVGFVTCKIQHYGASSHGVIDLIGVADEYRNRGIASALLSAALRWFSRHTRFVYVGTQAANSAATGLYVRNGFKPVDAEATLHLWLTKP